MLKKGFAAQSEPALCILCKHGIDPYVGCENLVFSPNRCHTQWYVDEVLRRLKAKDEEGADREEIAEGIERVAPEFIGVAKSRVRLMRTTKWITLNWSSRHGLGSRRGETHLRRFLKIRTSTNHRKLLQNYPDNLRSRDGSDCWLHDAARKGLLPFVKVLVEEMGLDVNEPYVTDWPEGVIDCAAGSGHVDVVELVAGSWHKD